MEHLDIQTSPHTSSQPAQQTPVKKSVSKEKEQWPELLPESWVIPTASGRWYERGNDFTAEEKTKAWDETAKIVKDYSDELVKRWKEEIDTLLVYAGLFSAVLTALIVESYKFLSPTPPDPVLAALQQISVQLNSFFVNPPFVNSTQPIVSRVLPPAPPAPRWAVWLNALWFSSLIFSLSAASVGIMVKQWLNEYSTGLLGDSRHFARLRQYRLRNLERWHVAEIVAILPVLLQIALALFLGGLLVLLWNLNSDVATVASVLIGVLFVFTIGSSSIPIFHADCCFLSPPVYVFFNAVRTAKAAIFHLHRSIWTVLCRIRRFFKCSDDGRAAPSYIRSTEERSWTVTWRGRELKQISESADDLDVAMVTKAYATTMDQSYLSDYATICFSDFRELSQVSDCYQGLVYEMDRHQQPRADIPLTIQSDLWLANQYAAEFYFHLARGSLPNSSMGQFTKFQSRLDTGGVPDMDRFWENSDNRGLKDIPTGASRHWRNHLCANVLIGGDALVPCGELLGWLSGEDYHYTSNTVRQRAARIVEQELRQHGQKAEDVESLRRCSLGLCKLLRWLGASSGANVDAQAAETAAAIRALTRHGLLCHFKCYTADAGKTLSLVRTTTRFVIEELHALCEGQAAEFKTPPLVDVLLRVYEVYQDEYQTWPLCKLEPWILKLKRERDESKNV